VLLRSDQEGLLLLRPLTGATDEVVAVHKRLTDLIGFSFPDERVRAAKFPPPSPNDLSNAAGTLPRVEDVPQLARRQVRRFEDAAQLLARQAVGAGKPSVQF
jgi:hypothetical protein